ncbi:hypothetical protein ACFY9N_02915 [Microbacterium sp. NPDC008134]|uniref:hypothetical protein n=1 Tax=Microbacterium sp. NPDC008134 TaxID=3364183 RepID=UPI0036ED3C7B
MSDERVRSLVNPENTSALPPMPKTKRDKAETFGAIVVFTPLVVTGLSFLIMAVPVVGIIGISTFLYFSLAWWIVGLASLFVLFLALWGNRQVALYGALGMLESLVLGMICSHLPGL